MKNSLVLAALFLGFTAPAFAENSLGIQSPIPFKGIATIKRLVTKGFGISANSEYPVFTASTPLLHFANSKIAASKEREYKAWLKENREAVKDDTSGPQHYEFESAPSLTYFKPSKLISLRFDSYEYTGGAHGMGLMETDNFAMVNGKPKQLVLGDLFAQGFDSKNFVQTKLLARLKHNPGAGLVTDGTVKSLDDAQLNQFSIAKDGLTWLFDLYSVGPYAAGQIEIKLSLHDLGPKFRRDFLK